MSHPAADQLVKAYNKMMERVRHGLEETESKVLPTVRQSIDKARKTAVELGELTHDEAEKVAAWLKRDAQNAGKHLSESSQQLSDWLRFDIDQIENRLIELFSGIADKTRLEILELEQELQQDLPHQVGEITGPGTLYCAACNEVIQFNHTSHILPCPKCGNETFRRWPVKQG